MLNLSALKNVITGMTPALPPEPSSAQTPSAVKAQVSKKTNELSRGKTEAQVERLTADLDAARLALAQA